MAEVFWPGGVQPLTAPVEIVGFIPMGEDETEATFFAPAPGTVIRYSAVSPERRSECAQLSQEAKDTIPEMTINNSGLALSEYTSLLNKRTYSGYHYSESIRFTNLVGETSGCSLFVSSSVTFLEVACPGDPAFAFDTRDSAWNGTTWVGLNENTGEWLEDPVLLFDYEGLTWNPAAFHPGRLWSTAKSDLQRFESGWIGLFPK